MKALVSIHPRFARLILSGEKKCEYRRRLPAKPISGIVIYATSPVSRIIGEAGVEAMPFLEKGELWRQTSSFGGDFQIRVRELFLRHGDGRRVAVIPSGCV